MRSKSSADRFVTSLVGPFDNVVGLPVRHALAALEALGFPR
jgi:predicted house-cleaning NTP pyrophosphatase (Maf/HAM1 superfamily)